MPTLETFGFAEMTTDQQLSLVTDMWNHILRKKEPSLLTEAQRAELRRRVAEDDANPDDVIPWEQVLEEMRAICK